jgi:integrase
MGTIQERVNGSYTVKVRRKGFPGLSRTFKERTDAEAWERTQEELLFARITAANAVADEERIASGCVPQYRIFADLMRRYLRDVTPHKRSGADEATRMRGLLKHTLAACTLTGLTSKRVAEWRDDRAKRVKGSTVNRDMNLLGHIIKIARDEWGLEFEHNPFHKVRRCPSGPYRDRRLSKIEELALLDACASTKNPFVIPIVMLALDTAMRRSEIVGLAWERVHFGVPSVQLIQTKNGKPRAVPLSRRAVATLAALAPQSGDGQLTGPVFPGLTPNALKLAYRRAVERAGIIDFRFHDLRHEATSRLFEKGLPVMEVASITGHEDVRMLRRYTHLHVGDLARKLD